MTDSRTGQVDSERETEVEMTAGLRELLAHFTPEEIETGAVRFDIPPDSYMVIEDIQQLQDALMTAGLEDSIGEALRTMRERHEFSLSDAAEAQGISRARAHQIEQPSANLQLDTILRAASAYGYHVQVVFTPKDGSGQAVVAKPAWVDTPDADSGT